MEVLSVLLTLPNPDYHFPLHDHTKKEHAVWRQEDVDAYYDIVELVSQAYRNPRKLSQKYPDYYPALYNPELDEEEAIQKVTPYIAKVNRTFGRSQLYFSDTASVELLELVSYPEMEYGFHYVTISRGADFCPEGWVLQRLIERVWRRDGYCQDYQGNQVPLDQWVPGFQVFVDDEPLDLNSLAFRTDRMLALMVKSLPAKKIARQGRLKVVMIPWDVDFYLSQNRGGEVVKETARSWV